MRIGTTFAQEYCKYLGLNPQKILDKIIQLGLNPIRVGIYWNELEIKPKEYNFQNFDWIMEKLAKKNIDIILAIGAKVPRWPEFHLPEFIKDKYSFKNKETINNDYFLTDIKKYLEVIFDHYKNNECIMYIQVENEPFEPFGPNKWTMAEKFLHQEIKFVRQLTKKPLVCTNGGLDPVPPTFGLLYGKYQRLQKCLKQDVDIIGLDVYPIIPQKILGKFHYFHAGNSQWKKLAEIKKQIELKKKIAWITELQAEPWEPKTMDNKDPFANPSCNPNLMIEYLNKCKKLGLETILLWGAEFWFSCLKNHNPIWVEKIKQYLIDQN